MMIGVSPVIKTFPEHVKYLVNKLVSNSKTKKKTHNLIGKKPKYDLITDNTVTDLIRIFYREFKQYSDLRIDKMMILNVLDVKDITLQGKKVTIYISCLSFNRFYWVISVLDKGYLIFPDVPIYCDFYEAIMEWNRVLNAIPGGRRQPRKNLEPKRTFIKTNDRCKEAYTIIQDATKKYNIRPYHISKLTSLSPATAHNLSHGVCIPTKQSLNILRSFADGDQSERVSKLIRGVK